MTVTLAELYAAYKIQCKLNDTPYIGFAAFCDMQSELS